MAHEKKPLANPSPEADRVAEKMLNSLHQAQWDSTQYLEWSFRYKNHYFWDKERHFVEVRWDDIKVLLHTKTLSGKVFQNDQELSGKAADKHLQKAWSSFCNDSFWLSAPMKAFDPGTSRSLVTLKDGREGLMVQYESGGVTPGDAYVWILDENHRPEAFKMWVSIIPIGGVEAKWSQWEPIESGALIARKRFLLENTEIPLTNIKGGNRLALFERSSDPFRLLEKQ